MLAAPAGQQAHSSADVSDGYSPRVPGANLGPVVVGAFALAALTYLIYRGAQRVRLTRAAGRPAPRAFTVAVVAYVVAWIGYAGVIVAALRGDL